MPDAPPLQPASREDLLFTLSHGLQFSTAGKPHRHGAGLAAQLGAEMLVAHLERSGYVVMKRPGHAIRPAFPYPIPGSDTGNERGGG